MAADRTNELATRAVRSLSSLPRPFLRWAGSKQRVLGQLVDRIPLHFETYFEPFLGAGSVFFLLQPEKAVLADTNRSLIEAYESVRDNPRKVLAYLEDLNPLDKDQYYAVRNREYRGRLQRAAQFIYLNRACWNGLYRVNASGKFNVPYGSPASSVIVAPEVLLSCSEALNKPHVELANQDFEITLADASTSDLAFLDPPYVTGHNNNGFIDYNEKLFSWADQQRLAALVSDLHATGCHVLVTNAHHRALLELYPRFNFDLITRHSTLAGKMKSRRPTQEVLLWQQPHDVGLTDGT